MGQRRSCFTFPELTCRRKSSEGRWISDSSEFQEGRRWIAYSSDESGRNEIYVRPFGAFSATRTSAVNGKQAPGKFLVSKDGGVSPLWRRDGKELFYLFSVEGNGDGGRS